MGFQQLYTEQQVVNIVEQIGSRDMNNNRRTIGEQQNKRMGIIEKFS